MVLNIDEASYRGILMDVLRMSESAIGVFIASSINMASVFSGADDSFILFLTFIISE